jgi:hypothetical protein
MGQEDQFALDIQTRLQVPLGDGFKVGVKQNLLYRLEIDSSGKLRPRQEDAEDPKRGNLFAFQTDVLIKKTNPSIPLVVVEVKFGGFSTHDVITYSSKATRHKDIYPYLRYGFVVGGSKALSQKLLTHNQGIDFAMSISDMATDAKELVALIARQVGHADKLAELMRDNRNKFTRYEKGIVVHL